MDDQLQSVEDTQHFQLFQKEIVVEEEGAREDEEGWPVSPPKEWGLAGWHGTRVCLHWASAFHPDVSKLDQSVLRRELEMEVRRQRAEGVRHPRLIEYFGVFVAPQAAEDKSDRLSLVMEAEGNGEPDREPLRERATRDPNLTPYETAVVMRDLATAFAFAHCRDGGYRGRLDASDVMVMSACDKNGYCQVQNVKVPPWKLYECVRRLVADDGEDPLEGSDIRSLGLLGLECYLGRKASPEPQKYRANMQYMDRSDELNSLIHQCLTAPVNELPSATEIVKRLDIVVENKKDSEDYYFDCLYGEPRNPREKIEQLEGQLKMAQENVDELEDEVRIQKEEYEDLDHSYDRSMQYQSSVVTERDELKKQMEEIKAAKRRRDHPFSFLSEGPPPRHGYPGSLFSDLFRSSASSPFSGAGLFNDYGFSSSPWEPSPSYERSRSSSTTKIMTPGFDGDPSEDPKRQELSVLLKKSMEESMKDRQTVKPGDLSSLINSGNFFGSSMESLLASFPDRQAPVKDEPSAEHASQMDDLGVLTSGSKLAEDLLKSLPKA